MPPKAMRGSRITSPSAMNENAAHTAEMSESKRFESL